jgi:Mg/Co/Ni transporter MgtE
MHREDTANDRSGGALIRVVIAGSGRADSAALLAVCTWATLIGAALPMIATRLGGDPAVISAPLVTTLVEGLGIVYLEAQASGTAVVAGRSGGAPGGGGPGGF